jgi:hypothetical protein
LELRGFLSDGSLTAKILDPGSQTYFRLEPADWRQAAFHDHIIRGGFIRSVAGESIERHEGRRVLISKAELAELDHRRRLVKPVPATKRCAAWLEKEMLDSPEQKCKPKQAFCAEAMEHFDVSERQFDQIWKTAIAKTRARWNLPGRPRKPCPTS